MAALLALSGLALALFPTTAATAAEVCAPPRCLDVSVPVPHGMYVPDNRLRVLLPVDHEDDPCRRWPVLYLFHGVGDTWESWSARSDVVELTRQFELIVVMPDGGRTPDAGWYSDWVDGSRQWERFHTTVMIPWVDSHFRTLGDGHRAVAGFSMGGFGAMSYAARHPGLFEAAASFSGVVDTMYGFPASGPGYTVAKPYAGTPDDRVWGNQLEDEATWRAHNPTDRATDLAGTELFVYAGTGAPAGERGDDPAKPANYAIEQVIFQMNLSFTRALDEAGVPYESDFHPGYHDWPYYEAGLHWALPRMMPAIAEQSASASSCPTSATDVAGLRHDEPVGGRGRLPATGGGSDPVIGLSLAWLGTAALLVAHGFRHRGRHRAR